MSASSEARVLAAAAALRHFGLDEIAALCDEAPESIVEILHTAGPALQPDGAPGDPAWRVADLDGLRGLVRARAGPDRPTHPPDPNPSGARLRLAEESLVNCGAEPSSRRRRILVTTAVNHLRQVLASTLTGMPPWWTLDIAGDRLDDELREHPDRSTAGRLSMDVAVARLAVGNTTGLTVPTTELIDTVVQFRHEANALPDEPMYGLVRGFVDLVTAQLAPSSAPAVDRLVVAVARRRVRAQVGGDLDAAMNALEPMVRALGSAPDRQPVQDLYQTVEHLPDGRDHVVVYADLLPLLPAQLAWRRTGEPLPGALVEVVADPGVADLLSRCARTMEADLERSGYGSDKALIGQAAHMFRELAEQHAGLDHDLVSRGDRTRSELMDLARTTVWPFPAADHPADGTPPR